DADKRVRVYKPDGTLRGTWTAGGISIPQDITTNGTDIWIVDAASRRIYRFANAASRLSGTQSPSASFALDSANQLPTGLVTDGSTLWVTNDHPSSDMVFVYSLAGAALGSWVLDPANDQPSGITLNPNGGTDLWVVDRRDAVVYRYAGATTRRSGSQAPADQFSLGAANKQP